MSFTKEQAKSTSILSIASSLGIELKKVSSNIYEWTEHDSFKIYENTNSFSWFSQSIHGDAIALPMLYQIILALILVHIVLAI